MKVHMGARPYTFAICSLANPAYALVSLESVEMDILRGVPWCRHMAVINGARWCAS